MSATSASYGTGPQSLCQHMPVLMLKKQAGTFSWPQLPICPFAPPLSLIQDTTGQSKCLCIRTSGWGQPEGNSVFFASSGVNTGVATTLVPPLSLCFWVMVSWAQVRLRVRAINVGMFVQQQVAKAKLCTQLGGQVQASENSPQVHIICL